MSRLVEDLEHRTDENSKNTVKTCGHEGWGEEMHQQLGGGLLVRNKDKCVQEQRPKGFVG